MRTKVISCAICALMITSILVIEVPKGVNAQITEEWVARYNGLGNKWDYATDIATDSFGNVYVTGYSYGNGTGYDYATIAHDSLGNELWVARYNGPENSVDQADQAFDMIVGSDGNIYVTGYSCSIRSYQDYATIAYDSSGNELWIARYDSPRNEQDIARAIAVDSSGNVYVTGESGLGTNIDYVTIAYDSSGNEIWVARYDGPGKNTDFARAIATDSSGNVYVTGFSYGIGTDRDYATIKYGSSGNQLWVARYNGPGSYSEDAAIAISVDFSGNVYVTGSSDGGATYYDYATIKYDSYGNELWVTRYDGPGKYHDNAYAISIGSAGNVYVTGVSHGGQTKDDYATIAYDTLGNQLWVARYNGQLDDNDVAYAMALDMVGNVYVTGASYGNGTIEDYVTIKYDRDGNERWVVKYDGPLNDFDRSQAIALDSLGNVYVTGWSTGIGTMSDYATIKYSQEEDVLQPTINIDPDTLNLKSKGRWITAYITLNSPYEVNDIDITTIMLEDTIPAEWGDIQGDILMVKFDRSDLQDLLPVGTYNLKVTGELADGTSFEGYSDEIRVIDSGK